MPNWTRLSAPPVGAFSTTWITRIGLIGLSLILGGAFLINSCFSTTPTDPESLAVPDAPAGPRTAAQLGARVQDIEQRTALELDAAERQLRAAGDQLSRGQVTPAFDATTGAPLPDGAAGPVVPVTEAEAELREILRLEAIERCTRSIRSKPVAVSYRRPPGDVSAATADTRPAPPGAAPSGADTPAASTPVSAPAALGPDSLLSTISALQALDQHTGGGSELAGGLVPAGLQRQSPAPAASPLGPAGGATVPRGDPLTPAIVRSPDTPPGWERIYEGSFIEAVLVNQLNGDFPGPVLAAVAVPFYSADRQRIVIPRGARVVGSASAVGGRDQERLAVGFHRLIFPDGRWVSLEFTGLNQIGEGALKDQVNRHDFAMFASVGAVGVIAGLTLRGSNPYAGGVEGVRAGAGQGLAQGATSILDRFLNRLPTITLRAGHRLRIWLTSDILVPRPA